MMDFVNSATELDRSQIITNAGTQARFALDSGTVREYMSEMAEGSVFPPIDVFYDGEQYYLADGFHRFEAAKALGRSTITANVRMGSVRDAILFAAGANADHGLKRTNEDKARSIMRLLEDKEWGQWSDREIARRVKCHHATVAKYRAAMTPAEEEDAGERKYVRNGITGTMATGNIGSGQGRKEYTGSAAGDADGAVNAGGASVAGDAGKPKAKCTVCGKPLSDPDSVARGMGDVCAGHATSGSGGGRAAPAGSTFVAPKPPSIPEPGPDLWEQLWDLAEGIYDYAEKFGGDDADDGTIYYDVDITVHDRMLQIIEDFAPAERYAEFHNQLHGAAPASPADEFFEDDELGPGENETMHAPDDEITYEEAIE